jgi:hypothetical protein
MSFTDMLRRRVYVDDQPVEAGESTSAGDLMVAAGQNPNNRNLVQANPGGTTEIIPSKKRVKLRNGDRFETMLSGTGGF